MAEYIERDTVLRCIKESREGIDWGQSEDEDAFLHYSACLYRTIASAECFPAADVVERKTGKWVKISPDGIYECSQCRQNVMTSDIEAYKFCHGCGAKMIGGDDDV